MEKIDLKKKIRTAFSGKKNPSLVEIPPMKYVTVSGKGDPNNSEDFNEAVAVIYGMAYTLKFEEKKQGRDFTVPPMEGQWWADDPGVFHESERDKWFWKVMIALPDYIGVEEFSRAKGILKAKKDLPGLENALLEEMEDGLSVQVLYVGPYAEEAATIASMHHFAEDQGYRLRGRHREVYLSDPRRTDPDKLKTIIRQPLEKA